MTCNIQHIYQRYSRSELNEKEGHLVFDSVSQGLGGGKKSPMEGCPELLVLLLNCFLTWRSQSQYLSKMLMFKIDKMLINYPHHYWHQLPFNCGNVPEGE